MFYRCTNSDSPISQWGHAMFTDNLERVDHYGENVYTFDGNSAIHIAELEQQIVTAWNECQESGEFGQLCDEYYESLSAEEIFNTFNPDNIVNSAEGWDTELVVWFWEFIAEPNGIMAVLTNDGAVVFDIELIANE